MKRQRKEAYTCIASCFLKFTPFEVIPGLDSETGLCYCICMSMHIRKEPSKKQFDTATSILKLVSDPTRLKILWVLLHGEHSVGEIAQEVNAKPVVVSQHLAKLRVSHMVSFRRRGTKKFYQAENEDVLSIIEHAFTQADHIMRGEHD